MTTNWATATVEETKEIRFTQAYLAGFHVNVSVTRAVASDRLTEALASIISFVFVVYSHCKHPKYII